MKGNITAHNGLKSLQYIWKCHKQVLLDHNKSAGRKNLGTKTAIEQDPGRSWACAGDGVIWESFAWKISHNSLLIETKAMGNRPVPPAPLPTTHFCNFPHPFFSAADRSFQLLGTKSEFHPRLLCFSHTHSLPNDFYFHSIPTLPPFPLFSAGPFPTFLPHHITRGRKEGLLCTLQHE